MPVIGKGFTIPKHFFVTPNEVEAANFRFRIECKKTLEIVTPSEVEAWISPIPMSMLEYSNEFLPTTFSEQR